MPFDYKKEYKEFYLPKDKPSIVTVPSMNYIAVRGKGDPNAEDGEYKDAIGLLYGIAFTIKMSKKGSHQIEGYFDYVVPPLEGFWWQAGVAGVDYAHKENFEWISLIRLPDFVTKADFDWAVEEATSKKKTDFSKVEFLTYDDGLCVQCMHIGPYYRGKIIGGLNDDRFLVKLTPSARAMMPQAGMELPYEGAKEMLLVDNVENREFLTALIDAMYDELPASRKKKV